MKKFDRRKFGEFTLFENLAKRISRSIKRLLIVSTNLEVIVSRIMDNSPN